MPDSLYRAAKALADVQEISLAELVRRGLEYMIATVPEDPKRGWELPEPRSLGHIDPFTDTHWRAAVHNPTRKVAEEREEYHERRDES